jgi:hypothetical protein
VSIPTALTPPLHRACFANVINLGFVEAPPEKDADPNVQDHLGEDSVLYHPICSVLPNFSWTGLQRTPILTTSSGTSFLAEVEEGCRNFTTRCTPPIASQGQTPDYLQQWREIEDML